LPALFFAYLSPYSDLTTLLQFTISHAGYCMTLWHFYEPRQATIKAGNFDLFQIGDFALHFFVNLPWFPASRQRQSYEVASH
jgi:hypothetical protein